jgi:hypothetical protein
VPVITSSKLKLGIDLVTYAAYHKSHIIKVMATSVMTLAFEDSIEKNGGEMQSSLAYTIHRARLTNCEKVTKTIRAAAPMDL